MKSEHEKRASDIERRLLEVLPQLLSIEVTLLKFYSEGYGVKEAAEKIGDPDNLHYVRLTYLVFEEKAREHKIGEEYED